MEDVDWGLLIGFVVLVIVIFLLGNVINGVTNRVQTKSDETPSKTASVEYWYNKGCDILGIGTQTVHNKATVINKGDSFKSQTSHVLFL